MIEQTTQEENSTVDYQAAVDQVIAGLRRHDFKHVPMRIVLAILEFSFCKARELALFPKQKHIARITGLAKQDVSKWLVKAPGQGSGWLLEKCVIEQKEGLYTICLPTAGWRVPLRLKEGKQLELAQLEAWLAKPGCRQRDLLPEPNLQEELTRSVSKLMTPVSNPLTRSVSKLMTPVSNPLTRSTAHIHDQKDHDSNSMYHARGAVLNSKYEVGLPGKMTGAEILEAVKRAAPDLASSHEEDWIRRIGESAITPKLRPILRH